MKWLDTIYLRWNPQGNVYVLEANKEKYMCTKNLFIETFKKWEVNILSGARDEKNFFNKKKLAVDRIIVTLGMKRIHRTVESLVCVSPSVMSATI